MHMVEEGVYLSEEELQPFGGFTTLSIGSDVVQDVEGGL